MVVMGQQGCSDDRIRNVGVASSFGGVVAGTGSW